MDPVLRPTTMFTKHQFDAPGKDADSPKVLKPNGIRFTLGTTNVPEPVSMVLLGTGLAGIYLRKRRQKN